MNGVDSGLVVIRCNASMKDSEWAKLHEALLKMKESGLIVLPPYCELIFVPGGLIEAEVPR